MVVFLYEISTNTMKAIKSTLAVPWQGDKCPVTLIESSLIDAFLYLNELCSSREPVVIGQIHIEIVDVLTIPTKHISKTCHPSLILSHIFVGAEVEQRMRLKPDNHPDQVAGSVY